MAGFIDKMVRAAKLDPTLYAEVEKDPEGLKDAMGVVVISSLAAGIGSVSFGGPIGLVFGAVAALVGWFIWSVLSHLIGTQILAEPQTRATLTDVMKVTGFAAAPGVIQIFGFIPLLGGLVNLVANLWMLAAFVVAIRTVLDYTSTGRALGVCVIGWLVKVAVFMMFVVLGLGGLALMASG
jgi:hypothetical protein